jgi:2-methylcitrate dehydratase PrpD
MWPARFPLTASSPDSAFGAFAAEFSYDDLPLAARERLELLLADMAAVCVAGRTATATRIAAEYAAAVHPGDEATLLADGRRTGAVGAAFANGVLANVLDFDDGHRLTKGHPGAVVIPAALAVAQSVDASPRALREAVVVGYEIAIRAGIALHARDPAYHASGAWGGVGAAAAAARLLGLDPVMTGHALGLAEYHAPVAPIMRSCAEPQMTKDACAWGASIGVSSALLAQCGFTATRPELAEVDGSDLGHRWRLQELYVKPFPCCRWSQGAVAAALAAGQGRRLAPEQIASVRVRTFAAADGLAKAPPTTTEEAQYSLLWPVACALAHGGYGVAEVLGPFDDAAALALHERIEITVDPQLSAAFPARRLTAVELELRTGERLAAGPLEAPGEPDDPGLPAVVAAKVAALIGPGAVAAHVPERLGDARPGGLLAALCGATERRSVEVSVG